MKIALYHRHIAPADAENLASLTASLRAEGVETVTVRGGDTVEGCDFLFSIGGDGTLLSSVQFVQSGDSATLPPILGINFGHLGFLTTVGRGHLSSLAGDLLAGRYTVEERSLLEWRLDAGQSPQSGLLSPLPHSAPFALNEVFLHRKEESSMLRTRVFVNGEYVATYSGDGVIVATPTGSTAYSLSCGGPILTPDSSCFAITPISAHALTLRPIIVPDASGIRLEVAEGEFTLGVDSRRAALQAPLAVALRRAPSTIRLIRMNTQSFFSAMRDKLMWGTDIRP